MSIKSTQNKKAFRQGFMLPDVMIAVFIAATALIAIIGAMSPLFTSEFFKRDEIIATGLAQEGIELIRNTRDNNWKTLVDASNPTQGYRNAFDGAFPDNHPGWNYCIDVDSVVAESFARCSNGVNNYLKADPNTGVYSTSGNGKFKRTVQVVPNGVDVVVTSSVSWVVRGKTHTVTLSDRLTPWGNK